MELKKIKRSKYSLSPEEQTACSKIIHTASVGAAGAAAGMAQLPLSDTTVITPIQITMLIKLGGVFDQEVTQTIANSMLGGMLASYVGKTIAQVGWGWIPLVGNASNAIIAATVTEALGWMSVDKFYRDKYQSDMEEKELTKLRKNFVEQLKRILLKKRADLFIVGKKTVSEQRSEYEKLLDDFEQILTVVEDDEAEWYNCYNQKLLDLM